MIIDDDLQSCHMEEYDEIEIDPIIDNMTEDELWRYLQIIISADDIDTQCFINNEEVQSITNMEICTFGEEVSTPIIDEDCIYIDSPAWSDDDSDLDRYDVSDQDNSTYNTPDYTDSDDDDGDDNTE